MQSIGFSQLSQYSQTTHNGLACDLVINGQAYTIRKNSQGGMIPALGSVVPTSYGTAQVVGYVGQGAIVQMLDYTDNMYNVYDGKTGEVRDYRDAKEQVAWLANMHNLSIESKIMDFERAFATETGKLSKEGDERIDGLRLLDVNEIIVEFTASWKPSDETEIVIAPLVLDLKETRTQREKRLAKERKELLRSADRFLDSIDMGDLPDHIMEEMTEQFDAFYGEDA